METKEQRILELTPAEKRKLQQRILGYGKLKQAADVSGLHFHTLRNVARIGTGEPDTIKKLRSTLLHTAA